mmetsp:Transcript_22467/g.88932  ORF Transcript_22467/g.88932 Transcript_22467/m.88932 type:complete len:349 (+) Transcript_22467:231-1277(+)
MQEPAEVGGVGGPPAQPQDARPLCELSGRHLGAEGDVSWPLHSLGLRPRRALGSAVPWLIMVFPPDGSWRAWAGLHAFDAKLQLDEERELDPELEFDGEKSPQPRWAVSSTAAACKRQHPAVAGLQGSLAAARPHADNASEEQSVYGGRRAITAPENDAICRHYAVALLHCPAASGTAFFATYDGVPYLVTAAHVVKDVSPAKIKVSLCYREHQGERVHRRLTRFTEGEFRCAYQQHEVDVAVVRVNATHEQLAKAMEVASPLADVAAVTDETMGILHFANAQYRALQFDAGGVARPPQEVADHVVLHTLETDDGASGSPVACGRQAGRLRPPCWRCRAADATAMVAD